MNRQDATAPEYDEKRLIPALRRAHLAGDVAAARALARRIQKVRAGAAQSGEMERPGQDRGHATGTQAFGPPVIEVELPDGSVAEFPEGTPQSVMRNALARRFPAKAKSTDELTPGISTNPTEGMSGGQRFMAGAGKSLRDSGLGIVQALSEGGPMAGGFNAAIDAVGLERPRNPIKEWADERIQANAEADSQLVETKAGLGGNIAGTVAQVLAPGGALKLAGRTNGMAGFAPSFGSLSPLFLPATLRGGVAQGAALGALQPVQEGQSRTANAFIGAGGGLLGGLLPRVIGAGFRAGNRLVEPLTARGVENIAGRTVQRFAANPNAAILPDPLLGQAPTLAEATLDPGIAQLQRAAASKSPEVTNAIYGARVGANDARVAALERFAGTPAQRQNLIEAIEKAEKAAYGKVRSAGGVDIAPVIGRIDAIMAGPEGKRKAVRSALSEAREALFNADGVPESSANMLLGARGAIRDLLEGRGENQAGKLAQRELIEIRDALDAAIRKVSPQIDAALDARRLGMRPVNEMDTINSLLQQATQPVPTQTGGLARGLLPSKFLRPTEDLDALARRGTGFRKAQGDDVLSGPAQDTIEGIRIGLARQQAADTIGKVNGSPTAQYLSGQNIMGGILGQPRPGSFMSGLANLGASAVDKPYTFIGVPERLNIVLARMLTNPQEAQAILARLPPPDRMLIEQAVGRLASPVGAAAATVQNRPSPGFPTL